MPNDATQLWTCLTSCPLTAPVEPRRTLSTLTWCSLSPHGLVSPLDGDVEGSTAVVLLQLVHIEGMKSLRLKSEQT